MLSSRNELISDMQNDNGNPFNVPTPTNHISYYGIISLKHPHPPKKK